MAGALVLRWTAFAMALLVAGCNAPAAPPVPPGAPFADYVDCLGGMKVAYAADCEDPQASERYSAPVSTDDVVPEGWRCAAGSDFREEQPGSPAWWLWTRPAPLDGPQPLDAVRKLLVGIEYDIAPRVGPVQGVFQMFSQPDAKILRWTEPGAHHFVEVGVARTDEEVEFDGVLLAPTTARGAIASPPTASFDERYPPESVINVTGIDVDSVEQSWGRHSRLPQDGWYPALFPTTVVRIGPELRYLPAFEFPIAGSGDPKEYAGSGHWGSIFHGAEWTNRTDGNATIQVYQAMHLRFDAHFKRLDQTLGCDFCPLLDPSDPLEGIRCRLP